MKYALRYLSFLLFFTVSAQCQAQQKPNPEPALISLEEAIPAPSNCIASPLPTLILQPNGTSLTIAGKGNMNNSWTETTDGYTIVRNTQGNYEYANKVNGKLFPTGVLATNPTSRTVAEQSFLANQSKHLKPDLDPLKSAVLNQVRNQLQNKTYPTTGNIRILALLIDYPDLNNIYPKADFDSLLYGKNFRSGDGSFKYFYETASDSVLTIDVDVMGWYRASNGYLYYSNDSGYDRAADLVREAVDAAEVAGVNYANYDNDSDGDVDGIMVVHSGPGAEQGGRTQYIWSHRWVMAGGNLGAVTYDNVSINDYMMNPETRTSGSNQNLVGIGVFCHEFGHNLGLPDLYDTDDSNGDSEGIGEWCLMASGTWLGGEHLPSNFSAWCKVENGWETPTVISGTTFGNYTLNPASTNPNEIYRINTSLNNEYFLLENRQAIGLDQSLRGTGLAIFHINTNQTNSFGNRVNGDESLKGVDLEEADGLNDLDNEVNRSDAGDLFPGTSNNTAFNDASNPSALTYLATNTGIDINNIAESSNIITFSIGNSSIQACNGGDTLTTASGTFDDGSGTANYANSLNCSWLIQPPGASSINLTFNRFDVDNTIDRVAVYDGNNFSAPLIGTYTGNSIPAAINSSGGSLYVEFTTNGSITASGWEATYSSSGSSPTCSGTTTLTAVSGTFDDGSGTANYDNNLNCSWLIQPTGSPSLISLDFTTMSLSFGDIVRIYDGTSSAGTLIGTRTGSFTGTSIRALSGSMFIEFTSNGSGTSAGWDASYISSNSFCTPNTTFTATSGTFNDGSIGMNYTNNTDCAWLIQPSIPGLFINLSFFLFQTELNNDTVTIYDGANSSAPILQTLSGNTIPGTIRSTGGSLFVTFKSNGSVTDFGWNASYSTQVAPFCSGTTTLTANTGTFDDGSAATANYISNSNCRWLIQPPGANRIALNWNRFDTQAGRDSVIVYDGSTTSAPIIGAFSGTSLPSRVNSSGGQMLVVFRSDNSGNLSGWEATYNSTTSQCFNNLTLTNPRDTLRDGSGASNYGDNLNCDWLIQPATAQSINLDFLNLDLLSGDSVFVYDGIDNSAPRLGAFSGNTLPGTISSTGGDMYVEFVTDASGNVSGWTAVYDIVSSLSCIGTTTLTAPNGNFEDGSGTANYDNNLNCSWLIQPTGNPLSITLTINNNNLANFGDRIRVYDGNSTAGNFLGTFFNNNTGSVTAFSGSMFVEFITDGSLTDQGWDATYSSSNSFCSQNNVLTGNFGNFDDGTPFGVNYANNTDCSWSIQPIQPNVAISLNILALDTELGNDTITVYDGTTINDPILATVSGTSTPPAITSSSNRMLVTFKSNGSITGQGFRASYGVQVIPFCAGQTTLTAPSGTFDDGSGVGIQYVENSNCRWLIQPAGAVSINLNFNYFNTQSGGDFVNIYDGTTTSAPLIGSFSGTTTPPTVSSGGSMLVEFTSNAFFEAIGFEAQYTSSTTVNLSIAEDTIFVGSGIGNSGTFNINSNTDWTISENANWLLTTTINGRQNQTVSAITTAPNFGPPRSEFVFATNTASGTKDSVLVIQSGSGNYAIANPDTLFYPQTGGQRKFEVLASVNWNVSSPNAPATSTISPNTGNGDDSVAITLPPNLTNNIQVYAAVLNSTAPNTSNDTVFLVQDSLPSRPPSLSSTPDTVTLNQAANSMGNFTINSTVVWQTSTPAAWLDILNPQRMSDTNLVQVMSNSMNVSTTDRFTVVAIQDIGGTLFDTVVVRQLGGTLLLDASPKNLNLAQAANSSANANLSSNLMWNATSGDPSWLNVSPSSGNGNANLTVSATTENTSISPRASFIALASVNGNVTDTIFVTQDGLTPTLSVTPNNLSLNQAASSSGNFTVNSNTSWQTMAGATWLTVVDPNPTSDTGVVQVIANTANANPNVRSSYVSIMDLTGNLTDTVWVDQLGNSPTLNALNDTVSLASSANSTVSLSLSSNLSWNSSNGAVWFTANPSNGTNSQNITLTANSDNTTGNSRFSFLAFAESGGNLTDTVIVVQAAQSAGIQTGPDTLRLAAAANSSGSFSLDAPSSTFSWVSNPQATWLDLSQNSGTGDATITATANSTNSSFNERSTLVLSSASSLPVEIDTLVVIQAGQQPQLSVNPSSLNLNFAAGSNDQLTVTANVSWTVSNPVTWLNLSTNSGSNNANITVSAITDNLSGSSRTANLTFSSPGLPDVMVMITQIDGTAPSFQVSRDTIFVDETAGSTANFSVLANAVDWSLSENIPWLVVNPARGNNTQLITLTAAGNNIFGNQRSGTIIASADGFSDTAITVIQRSSTPLFQTSPTVLILGSDAQDEVNFNISSNLISWKVEESSNWMTVSPDSGAFSSRITVRATETNNSGNVRTDMITVTAPPLVPQTIMVTQDTIRAIGLSENSVQESLEVFPNPSSGLLNITFESKTNQAVEYALFNSLGAQINAPEVLRLDKQIQLNLAALPAGFYFLNLRIDGKAHTRKIALINK